VGSVERESVFMLSSRRLKCWDDKSVALALGLLFGLALVL